MKLLLSPYSALVYILALEIEKKDSGLDEKSCLVFYPKKDSGSIKGEKEFWLGQGRTNIQALLK